MTLDYSDLLSPRPLHFEGIGSIKSPTINEVWDITYYTYAIYVNHVSMSPENYYKTYKKGIKVSPRKILNTTKFDLVLMDESFRNVITDALNFFFVEDFSWYPECEAFLTKKNDSDGNLAGLGVINRNNYSKILQIILQRVHITPDENEVDDLSKARNRHGKQIYATIHERRQKFNKIKNAQNKDLTFGNILSSVVSRDKTLTWTNVGDITVFQLFDSYQRLQIDDQYTFLTMRVAAWGDKDKSFRLGAWGSNIYDKTEERSAT